MQIDGMVILFNFINVGLIIVIIIGIFKVIKEVKKFIDRNKQMDKKLDIILN
ncbi:hypothetical protein HMPREF1084_01386 [Clostridium butyricum 60E.3]|jgi:uncharacterized protein YneF (UPF0154 family)|uniref:Uncharacterized protein n=1 Tax=Clostridium butyricum TaxID=1492 RepID=A0A6N3HCV4_CLOBU|nr:MULTISPECIES: hypothetical protein [Clostridium]ENZ34914.1 hypothetical protein HMPREF1084_01386 [Clostridium butyricum 60E.3]MDB2136916.1 hypothetical protein [Clostridium butyricum]MDB2155168.1 hypothetical protein [Clostridium butyricum]MDI9208710.1 hypothetical protein [Clostridium butyricum]MDU0321698.1 hypothetical protein [Clostridium butyricum]